MRVWYYDSAAAWKLDIASPLCFPRAGGRSRKDIIDTLDNYNAAMSMPGIPFCRTEVGALQAFLHVHTAGAAPSPPCTFVLTTICCLTLLTRAVMPSNAFCSQMEIYAEMRDVCIDVYRKRPAVLDGGVVYEETIGTPTPTAARFQIVMSDGHHELMRPVQVRSGSRLPPSMCLAAGHRECSTLFLAGQPQCAICCCALAHIAADHPCSSAVSAMPSAA